MSFFENQQNIVPITPICRSWISKKTNCVRTMIPFLPGYAVSIHKSQGMSLDKVIINLGPREFATGLSYTAISRCRKIKNLSFSPFPNYTRFRNMFQNQAFKDKVNENKNLEEKE